MDNSKGKGLDRNFSVQNSDINKKLIKSKVVLLE